MKNDPNFRPPVEYHQQKRSQRPSDKVYIPVKEFPEINFFGLLVGPRGNSLKKMERESGAKISIRGKGSVKEGKARPDQYADDAEEDLHCLVLAETEEKVAACVRMINRVIETVSLSYTTSPPVLTSCFRLLPPPRVKTIISVTNCASWPH
jgi:splicing factor 1